MSGPRGSVVRRFPTRRAIPFAALALAAAVVTLAVAVVPDIHGAPWSFRLEPVSFLPGVPAILRWDARRHARHDFRHDRRLLFGFGQSGTDLEIEGCRAVEYVRDPRRSDLGGWLSSPLHGHAGVACDDGPPSATRYEIVEMGCLPPDVVRIYGTEYNRRMLALVEGR